MSAARTYALVRRPGPAGLSPEAVAAGAGLHPDLVHRFAVLGLLEVTREPSGRMWFAADQVARVARIRRLRAGLSLNYAAVGLVLDLLDRIDALEAALRADTPTRSAPRSRSPWT